MSYGSYTRNTAARRYGKRQPRNHVGGVSYLLGFYFLLRAQTVQFSSLSKISITVQTI